MKAVNGKEETVRIETNLSFCCPIALERQLFRHTLPKPEPQPVPSFESNVRMVLLDVVVTDPRAIR